MTKVCVVSIKCIIVTFEMVCVVLIIEPYSETLFGEKVPSHAQQDVGDARKHQSRFVTRPKDDQGMCDLKKAHHLHVD